LFEKYAKLGNNSSYDIHYRKHFLLQQVAYTID